MADSEESEARPAAVPSSSAASDSAGVVPDPDALVQIARMRMPFGRYEGTRLIDLPEPYVVWFRRQGFPRGRLGVLLATLYEIKANGLEHLIRELRDRAR